MTFDNISHNFMKKTIAIQIDDESKINAFAEFIYSLGLTEPNKYSVGDIIAKSFDRPQVIIYRPIMCKTLHMNIIKLSEIDTTVAFKNKRETLDFDIEIGSKEQISRSIGYNNSYIPSLDFYEEGGLEWNGTLFPSDGSNDDIDDFGDFS